MEKSEKIEDEVLEKIAKSLGVTTEAIKNFNEEAVINYFNNFHDNSVNHGPLTNFNHGTLNVNPIDKWLEVIEENKKLYNEKIELLERLLASEQEKVELLKNR